MYKRNDIVFYYSVSFPVRKVFSRWNMIEFLQKLIMFYRFVEVYMNKSLKICRNQWCDNAI